MRERLIELLVEADNTCQSYEAFADNLLANGVIVLPVNLGEAVYDVYEFFGGVACPEIYKVKDNAICIEKGTDGGYHFTYGGTYISHADIGKTVFATKEEAERALAERSKHEKKID